MQEWLKPSDWINSLLHDIEKSPTAEKLALIEHCGRSCAEQSGHLEGILALRKAAAHCRTRADYVAFLREHFPFDADEAEDGILIRYRKTACSCRLAPDVASPLLCLCTQGHEKAMWSVFFGKEINTEIVESFQRGGNDCVMKLFV